MKHATKGIDDSMIPIARPQVGDPEIENVVHVLRSSMLAGGRGGSRQQVGQARFGKAFIRGDEEYCTGPDGRNGMGRCCNG